MKIDCLIKGEALKTLLLSILLFYLSFIPSLAWLIFICFAPFLHYLKKEKSLSSVLLYGYVFGLLYFTFTSFWLINVKWLLLVFAVLFQSVFMALFAYLYYKLSQKKSNLILAALLIPSLWICIEFLRSVGYLGLPTGYVGYQLSPYLNLLQLASLTGIFGLSFFVILINTLVLEVVAGQPNKKIIYILSTIIIIVIIRIFGQTALKNDPFPKGATISIVQANISGEVKWNLDFIDRTIAKHKNISQQALTKRPDLIVWPETAVPTFLFHPERKNLLTTIQSIAKELKIPILLGTQDIKIDRQGKTAFNASVLFSPQGNIVNQYAKIKLVPFVELSPLKNLIPFFRKHGLTCIYSPGREYTVFEFNGIKLASPICFETLFPNLIRRFAKKDAQLLINISNDAPALGTMKFFYRVNADMNRIRAIENKKSVIRATNNGISMFIDPFGRIIKELSIDSEESLTATVPLNNHKTFYTRYGDWIVFLCFGLLLWEFTQPKKS